MILVMLVDDRYSSVAMTDTVWWSMTVIFEEGSGRKKEGERESERERRRKQGKEKERENGPLYVRVLQN